MTMTIDHSRIQLGRCLVKKAAATKDGKLSLVIEGPGHKGTRYRWEWPALEIIEASVTGNPPTPPECNVSFRETGCDGTLTVLKNRKKQKRRRKP